MPNSPPSQETLTALLRNDITNLKVDVESLKNALARLENEVSILRLDLRGELSNIKTRQAVTWWLMGLVFTGLTGIVFLVVRGGIVG